MNSSTQRLEHWEADAGDTGVAHLDIPPHAQRDRTFEVWADCAVRAVPGHDGPWHEMRMLLNGAQQWVRRVPTHPEGPDSLDYRVRCKVPLGEPLRITVTTGVHGARRLSLRVVADEA